MLFRELSFSRIRRFFVHRLFWALDELLWAFPSFLRKLIIGNPKRGIGITVIVSTYVERFDTCFKPVILRLAQLFPSEQIIVVANGHYDTERQLAYLSRLREFCSQFPAVELYDFVDPVSISKMSNTSLLKTKNPIAFSINEDLRVSILIRRFLEKSGILKEQIATINRSWCHIVISLRLCKKIGYFDERAPEIGGEDDDYAARCALAGIEIKDYKTLRIGQGKKIYRARDRLNSWGRDMTKQIAGYSSLNTSFFMGQKWETSNDPFEGAIFVPNRIPKYWKQRNGMETPNFYPELHFLEKE